MVKPRLSIISGCSGGGKSTLLSALHDRGFCVVPEPGRRIVQKETNPRSNCLPWNNLEGFAKAAIKLAIEDYQKAQQESCQVFFDRSLIDALAAYQYATGIEMSKTLLETYRYDTLVFMVPPWPEIYLRDQERQHSLEEAIDEYQRLITAYQSAGYQIHVLDKTSVPERVSTILAVTKQ